VAGLGGAQALGEVALVIPQGELLGHSDRSRFL
jgi:hypothetical protein